MEVFLCGSTNFLLLERVTRNVSVYNATIFGRSFERNEFRIFLRSFDGPKLLTLFVHGISQTVRGRLFQCVRGGEKSITIFACDSIQHATINVDLRTGSSIVNLFPIKATYRDKIFFITRFY